MERRGTAAERQTTAIPGSRPAATSVAGKAGAASARRPLPSSARHRRGTIHGTATAFRRPADRTPRVTMARKQRRLQGRRRGGRADSNAVVTRPRTGARRGGRRGRQRVVAVARTLGAPPLRVVGASNTRHVRAMWIAKEEGREGAGSRLQERRR